MKHYENIYFLGIGGIGMSALARFFMHEGVRVAGYDRVRTPLCEALESEGADIHYEESIDLIPQEFRNPKTTMVVYTPAVPVEHAEYRWFTEQGFNIEKRSQMLGQLSHGKFVMAVAGTHGKTTTSTLVAWLNHAAADTGSAFLGGISKNFSSNILLGKGERLAVEADEFDRSFLRLNPNVAIITSADADHLDIYLTHENMKEAFSQFIDRIEKNGALIIKQGVELEIRNRDIAVYRYSYDEPSDFYARNIRLLPTGCYLFDMVTPDGVIEDCTLGIPGWVNVENAIAATASLWCATKRDGIAFDHSRIKEALASFQGVKRRFEFYVNTPKQVYMDDYAHHPRELMAAITSVKRMFPAREVTAIFQPHLYTRTRDFYKEFAEALSVADEVVLLPIYPAREEPIQGVNSEMIARLVSAPCRIVERESLAQEIEQMTTDIVVSFGAGNIDACCAALNEVLQKKS